MRDVLQFMVTFLTSCSPLATGAPRADYGLVDSMLRPSLFAYYPTIAG
jgi:hypothetical protein